MILYPHEIVELLNINIQGQYNAKRSLSMAMFNQLRKFHNLPSLTQKNVLMIGPTGVGKTALITTLAATFDLPFYATTADVVTARGWHGGNITDIIHEYVKANLQYSVPELQYGIIFLDEVDKIGAPMEDDQQRHHYKSCQASYLTTLEGTKVKTEPGIIDTTNIMFVAAGAFSNLKDYLPKTNKNEIGFNIEHKTVTLKDESVKAALVAYGFMEEFIGRFGTLVQLENLTASDYREILTLGEHSMVNEYISFFDTDDIKIFLNSTALEEIAIQAVDLKLGVRGLKSILHKTLEEYIFNMYDNKKKEITITGEFVKRTLSK